MGQESAASSSVFGNVAATAITGTSVRGGAVTGIGQAAKFAIQLGSTMALARLLTPTDFGLQGMVLSILGVLALFRDAGLSAATIQRAEISHEQTSTLFWVNTAVGALLAILAVCCAPVLARLFNEPRLSQIVAASAMAFVLNGLAVQHQALLNRQMQFARLVKIDVAAMLLSSVVGIGLAAIGMGYWALVIAGIAAPLVTVIGVWRAVRWVPGRPKRGANVREMLHFGGTATLNSLVVYLAYNVEKVLLGRSWGADSLGLYGRAFQLVTLPVQQVNSSMNSVAFPALSRLQDDPIRLKASFLKGYSVLISMTLPPVIICAIFAEEIVSVVLGSNWSAAGPVLRLLTPTALALGLIHPLGWILMATGRVGRNLMLAVFIAPIVITGVIVGLPYGPNGVALGYSIAMSGLVIPFFFFALRGTGIAAWDMCKALVGPITSGVASGAAGLLLKFSFDMRIPPLVAVTVGATLCTGIFAATLLFAFGQKNFYRGLWSHLRKR